MQTGSLFKHLAFSITPHKSRLLVEKKFGQVTSLYFTVWAISIILLFLTGLVHATVIAPSTAEVLSPTLGPFSVDATTTSSFTLLWMMLPGLAFLVGLFIIAGSLVLSFFSALFAKILRRKKVSFRDAWVVSVHALLLPILLFSLFIAFTKLFVLILVLGVLYILIFVLAIVLLEGYNLTSVKKKSQK